MNSSYYKQDFLVFKDSKSINDLINNLFPKCLGIAKRYCKTDEQANKLSKQCFLSALKILLEKEEEEFDNTTFINQYTICIVKALLSERKGELIADTTIVSTYKKQEPNLFANSEYYKTLSSEELIQYIRKLNTLQQVIYNLIYIDNFSISKVAEIIEHNELSIKALSEKAKYNLYSSIKSIV